MTNPAAATTRASPAGLLSLGDAMSTTPFLADITNLRARARRHIEQAAAPRDAGVACTAVVDMLNAALATELVCVLRYRRHHFLALGMAAQGLARAFLDHADEELEHADHIAARIVQLGGAPDFSPEGLTTRSLTGYGAGSLQAEMLAEDIGAERIAIDGYGEMLRHLGDGDQETRRLLERIRATEARHVEDLEALLQGLTMTHRSEGVAAE